MQRVIDERRPAAAAEQRAPFVAGEQRAVAEAELLYELLDRINRASSLPDIYDAGIDVVRRAIGVSRAAILLFDDDDVMRFKAWHGLSDAYRLAVEGHTPWTRDSLDAQTIVVVDVATDPLLKSFVPVFRDEKIAAMAFIPLLHQGRVIGKFMVYSERPRDLSSNEIRLIQTIANQVAGGVVRKRAEVEVKEARAAAEQSSRMKDEFLAVVSHELRTPLSTIAGWVSLLRRSRRDDPALLEKGLDVIERNLHAQKTLIEDILDVSRVVSGKLVLDPHVVSLTSVVEEALDSARMSATAKQIALTLEKPGAPCTLVGDPDRLRQIVWNLLSNAIKFTPVGGQVTVRLGVDSHNVCVAVSDTGRGIEQSFLPFVFDRFRQGDSTTTRRQAGLGLGLAIVRHLVELHGGEVNARSEGLNRGATFTVFFPRAPAAARPPSPRPPLRANDLGASAPTTARLDGLRVLIVDDDADAREITTHVLSSYGAETCAAHSVESALGVFEEFLPDVLVSDIGMPDADGTSLVKRLHHDVRGGHIPSIALTAYARPEEANRTLDAGFDRHLAKPAAPDVLVTLIRELADHARKSP